MPNKKKIQVKEKFGSRKKKRREERKKWLKEMKLQEGLDSFSSVKWAMLIESWRRGAKRSHPQKEKLGMSRHLCAQIGTKGINRKRHDEFKEKSKRWLLYFW